MYQKILVPLDGSELAECVLPHLEAIANGCGTREVVFLRVVGEVYMPEGAPRAYFSEEDIKRMQSQEDAAAREYLANIAGKVQLKGAEVKTEAVKGRAADRIAEYAESSGADLVVIATHGRSGVSRWAFGSVADHVLRSVCVPVMMVRAPGCIPGF